MVIWFKGFKIPPLSLYIRDITVKRKTTYLFNKPENFFLSFSPPSEKTRKAKGKSRRKPLTSEQTQKRIHNFTART